MRFARIGFRNHRRFLTQSGASVRVHTSDIRMKPSGFSGQFGRLPNWNNLRFLLKMRAETNQAVDRDADQKIDAHAPVDV